ncbi:MAG: Hsp20/alpha crystallin family protein [Coriobacteriia bacterium]|nr:Hsp20/alpha crystallin family protein [Coriobacteriia bacterium]
MASLVRWDPFRDLMDLQHDVGRLFGDLGFAPLRRGDGEKLRTMPSIDVFSRGDDLMIKAEMPGISPDDVDISVTDDVLTVRAQRRTEEKIEEEDYLVRETSYGSFERSLRLPTGVDPETITADYRDGILEVRVPGGAPCHAETHKIEVTAHTSGELPAHH